MPGLVIVKAQGYRILFLGNAMICSGPSIEILLADLPLWPQC